MKKKEFKAESKKILSMMINSIYTNEEIFLRELISNASDALDKLYYNSLTDKKLKVKKDDLKIKVSFDKDKRTITISDNGIGMTKDELENNLGTIAKSGSELFKLENEKKKDIDIIGQFGVGFYSSFMVSEKVEVLSKSAYSTDAYLWESSGIDGYTITSSEMEDYGTIITLHLKEDNDNHKYSEYLDDYNLERIIKKYSDYITYPIVMNDKTINSMVPIWKKNKKDVKEDDYNNFYKDRYYDFENPIHVIKSKVEGLVSYDALLFIPSHASNDYYTKEYEKGLELYSKGVLITNKCSELLPDYFSFVKGIVDSEDIDLNISRETMQLNHQVKSIAKSIESKIKKELLELLNENRSDYEKFFKEFGSQIKYGIYSSFGMNKELLQDLLLFNSSFEDKLTTLAEYKSRLGEDGKKIYYAAGETIDKIKNMPQVENMIDKGNEVLYLTDYLDEFTIKAMNKFEELEFVNVQDTTDEVDDEEIKKVNEDNKDLLTIMKSALSINDVKFSDKLKNHPVALTSVGEVSLEMEKVFKAMPNSTNIKANKVLLINTNHPVYEKLVKMHNKKDDDGVKEYTNVLYNMALLINGLSVDNPNELTETICNIISK
jgi:molecular chaperone HtpG